MRYLTFTIANYRAVEGPVTIDVESKRLIPIIGVNEAGKTTLLHAIFAFDHNNDALNQKGRHLVDVANLYRTNPPAPTVTAEVELSQESLNAVLDKLAANSEYCATIERFRRRRQGKPPLPSRLTITRDLRTKRYSVVTHPFQEADFQDDIAREVINHLPYILYFDDFRDKIDGRIPIDPRQQGSPQGWLAILEQLFRRTDQELSVFSLADMEERQRKTVLSKVQRRLNETLTREWQNFRLDDRDALEIALEFEQAPDGTNPPIPHIKFHVVERGPNGEEHYFYVSDRSKGFFWFFNFVMKLEFNPKVVSEDGSGTIYLLDEPGSYLHAFAQTKLCKKLRALSDENRVLYCTHSHYLLDPETIPLATIHIADRDERGRIALFPIHAHKAELVTRMAYQPVLDALQVKPFGLDVTIDTIVIVEGIIDYYCFELLKGSRRFGFLPSVGAGSTKYLISLMLAWGKQFWALWDNDDEGRRAKADAEKLFGPELAQRSFRLLPIARPGKRIIQDLFDGEDLRRLREKLQVPTGASFDKTIASVFYAGERGVLIDQVSARTKENFDEVFDLFVSEALPR